MATTIRAALTHGAFAHALAALTLGGVAAFLSTAVSAAAMPAPAPTPSPTPAGVLERIGSATSVRGASANQTITGTSTLDTSSAAQTRGVGNLESYAYDLPGVVYFHSAKSNLDHFKIRGADNEPRTEIDGHPLTNTGAGNFLVGWLNAFAFDRIDVEKGPGIAEGDEGRSAFGTIDLISRTFSATPQFDSVLGFSNLYGSTVSLLGRGPLFGGRLQYVLADNYSGGDDPNHDAAGLFFGPARTNLTGAGAVAQYASSLSGSIGLRNEIAKLRYAFSPVTSLEAGFLGFSGIAAPLGSSYAGYEGTFVVAPGTTATNTGTTGIAQPFYSGYTNGSERVNEPMFEGAFRTQVGRADSLVISPFTMTLSDILAYAPPPAALSGFPNSKFTGDRMHGTTFTYTHPFGDGGYVKLNYEYRSDTTTVYTGTSFTPATLTTPPTALHENDLSLTSALNVAPRLTLGLGLFYDGYHNDGWYQPSASLAAGLSSTSVPFQQTTIVSNHVDPHLGLVYQSGDATWLRASYGSSVYGPGSTLVSGRASYAAPAPSNNNQGLVTTVNPNLQPEVTVAFGAGLDHRFRSGTLLSFDLYDDTVHDKFLSFVSTGGPLVVNGATVTPLVSQTINASLQRNFGAELGLHRTQARGFAYDVALALDRQYYDQIPPAYFLYAGGPVSPFNGYQGTTYPYFTAHAEFRYGFPGMTAVLGEDTAGADNVQRAPGFTTVYTALQIPVARGVAFQIAVDNVFNYQTSALTFGTGPTGSGSSTITAYPAGGVLTAPLTYSQTLVNVQGVQPRTVRASLITHLGPR